MHLCDPAYPRAGNGYETYCGLRSLVMTMRVVDTTCQTRLALYRFEVAAPFVVWEVLSLEA